MRKVPVTESVGMALCHDITRIISGSEKGRVFKRGHIISSRDIPVLLDIGKKHVFVWEETPDMIHEDEAALRLARQAAGPGLSMSEPNQGRVNIRAKHNGLLKVQPDRLHQVNRLHDICFATLHNNRPVSEGQTVAGTRVIPLAVQKSLLEEAESLCGQPDPLIAVKPFQSLWVGIVITGSEVYEGRIKDGFCSILRQKIAPFGGRILGQVIVPDDPNIIAQEILRLIREGADLVLVTGGMSVDPDDVTPVGIRTTGADPVAYGAPVLPGSMFMLAYLGHVVLCGLPGCVMFNRNTIFDLILPRIFVGERLQREDITSLGHGGLCEECADCHYPSCSFGKSSQ